MERREFLESSALGLSGLAMASALIACAPGETAGEPAQTKVASTPAETAGESTQNKAIDIIREWDSAKAEAYLKVRHESLLDERCSRHQDHRADQRWPERRLHKSPAGTHAPSHQGRAASGRHPKRDPAGDRGGGVHGDPFVQSRRADAA